MCFPVLLIQRTIEKNNAAPGRGLRLQHALRKEVTDAPLAVARIAANELWSGHLDKRHAELSGNCMRQQCLTAAC